MRTFLLVGERHRVGIKLKIIKYLKRPMGASTQPYWDYSSLSCFSFLGACITFIGAIKKKSRKKRTWMTLGFFIVPLRILASLSSSLDGDGRSSRHHPPTALLLPHSFSFYLLLAVTMVFLCWLRLLLHYQMFILWLPSGDPGALSLHWSNRYVLLAFFCFSAHVLFFAFINVQSRCDRFSRDFPGSFF